MVAWAFVIGINDYPAETKQKPLNGAVADAADFASWALDPAGGQVAPANLYFWTCPKPAKPPANFQPFLANPTAWPFVGPKFDRPPTAAEINHAIAHLAKQAVQDGATRFYVFFAGHGVQTAPQSFQEDPQSCFVAGDFLPDMPAIGLVPCDDLRRMLCSQGPAEIILFLDCCRNSLPLKVPRPAAPFNVLAPNGLHERCGIGRAAQGASVAYEVPLAQPQRGAFTQMLVFGLREFRVNGSLTLRDLDDYVTAALADMVKPLTQTPDFDEKPRPPALLLAQGPPMGTSVEVEIDFGQVAPGTQLNLVDSEANLIESIPAAAVPVVRFLRIGSYALETSEGEVLAAFNVTGPSKTHVQL
jgi:uncharacterized caspase-like protein